MVQNRLDRITDASYYARCIGEASDSDVRGLLRIALMVACAEPINKQKEASVANIAKGLGAKKGTYTVLLREYNKPNYELITLSKATIGVLSVLVGGKKSMQRAETKYLTDMVSGYALMDSTHDKWVDHDFDQASYIRVVINARSSVSKLDYYVARFSDCSTNLKMQSKIEILVTMKELAELGGINKGKLEVMEKVARLLNVPDYKFAELFGNKSRKERLLGKPMSSHLSQYYEVLGCNPNDSLNTIKHKYRRLVSQFHPDSLSGKGLSDETISEANDITRGIIEAYEQIKRGRCQV